MSTEGRGMTVLVSTVAGALGGIVATLLFVGAPVTADDGSRTGAKVVVTAGEFRLTDDNGQPRAVLAFSAEGEPYLAMLDPRQNQRVWLGLAANPGLAIKDAVESKTRALLSIDDANGQPSLVLRSRTHDVAVFQPKEH